jgi:2-octaprenyl-6-methoxyphenol hydroxylase
MGEDLGADFDVAVIGGGAVGFAAALAAAISGASTAIFAPRTEVPRGRTAALLTGSISLLSELDVWPALMRHAAPLRAIRMVDGTRRLIRAPETVFYASEIGLAVFGFNVPNADLVDALRRHAEAFPGLTVFDAPATSVDPREDDVRIAAEGRSVTARLAVAADGARSQAREAAGIAVRTSAHRQSALVAILSAERAHAGVATEFHFEGGPFTLVPLPGDRVSLVWVDRPERIGALAQLAAPALARAVEDRAHSLLGEMRLDGEPAVFPLRSALAERFAARRVALVGEAAHLFPPIGAQGLNLGFRDVACLRSVFARHGADPGGAAPLRAYGDGRQADVRSRALAVELLNRSLLTPFLPVQAARGAALAAIGAAPPLRRALMRVGLGRGA